MSTHEEPRQDGTRPGRREPIRKPWIWLGVLVVILIGIPWYLPEGTIGPIVLGMPLWTLGAIASSVLLCVYLSWMLLRHWNLVEDEEEAEQDGESDRAGRAGPWTN